MIASAVSMAIFVPSGEIAGRQGDPAADVDRPAPEGRQQLTLYADMFDKLSVLRRVHGRYRFTEFDFDVSRRCRIDMDLDRVAV